MKAARSPARPAPPGSRTRSSTPAARAFGELRELVELAPVRSEHERAGVSCRHPGHGLAGGGRGPPDERPLGRRAALQGGLDRGRVAGEQHERQARSGAASGGDRRRVRRRPAAGVVDRQAVEAQMQTDALDLVAGDASGHVGEPARVAAHAHDETGLVVEGLLVAEQGHLVAHLEAPLAGAHADEPDGRRRGRGEGRPSLVAHVRAGVELGAFLGELHGEGQAGGIAALLAVGLRQELVDLQSGEGHRVTLPARR